MHVIFLISMEYKITYPCNNTVKLSASYWVSVKSPSLSPADCLGGVISVKYNKFFTHTITRVKVTFF